MKTNCKSSFTTDSSSICIYHPIINAEVSPTRVRGLTFWASHDPLLASATHRLVIPSNSCISWSSFLRAISLSESDISDPPIMARTTLPTGVSLARSPTIPGIFSSRKLPTLVSLNAFYRSSFLCSSQSFWASSMVISPSSNCSRISS